MNDRPIRFALNHMVAPQLSLPEFFALARTLGMPSVEIRNDVAGQAILDGTPAATVRRWAADEGVEIIAISALQKFNHWSDDRAGEAVPSFEPFAEELCALADPAVVNRRSADFVVEGLARRVA